MYTDLIPLPSKGLFYPKDDYGRYNDYIEVAHLTTDDELMMTSPNLFAKGDALYRLLERKIKPYNSFVSVDDLLVYDKDFIILWIRENAYGNMIEEVTDSTHISFNTHNMEIRYIDMFPDEETKLYDYTINNRKFKIKPISYKDERLYGTKKSKLINYLSHVFSIDGIEDKSFIFEYIKKMPIKDSRLLKIFIDKITFGVNTKTWYTDNYIKKDTIIELDEIFFGFNQGNLDKTREVIQSSIFFLLNEGQGYTNKDVMEMTTYNRLYNIDKLNEKIKRLNEEIKK